MGALSGGGDNGAVTIGLDGSKTVPNLTEQKGKESMNNSPIP
jgi:hypothetical protein